MRVTVIAADGVLDSSLSLTVDILATANRLGIAARGVAPFVVEVVGGRSRNVRLGSGHTAIVDGRLGRDTRLPALIIVPGWNQPEPEPLIEALTTTAARRMMDFLRYAHAHAAVVAASCSATFLLAEAGLLEGSLATTTWWLAPYFRERYPRVQLACELTVARADRIYTAGAALSHVDLMLALVSRFAGPRIGRLCVRYLSLETHPTQARYMMTHHLARDHAEVRRAEAWIRAHVAESFTVADVAKAARTSPRTLARRIQRSTGTTPVKFVQRLRVEHAAHLLEATELPFDEISRRVGYAEPAALRSLLRRELGEGPRELRRRARGT